MHDACQACDPAARLPTLPCTDAALRQLMPSNVMLPAARSAVLTSLQAPDGSGLLDRGLVLRFPAPRSFTGAHTSKPRRQQG